MNTKIKVGIFDVILYLIVFIVVQLIVTIAGAGIWAAANDMAFVSAFQALGLGENAALLALTTVFSSVISFIIFVKAKWTPIARNYLASKPWFSLMWVALFTLGLIIPLQFIFEKMGVEMDPQYQHLFEGLMKEPWGYVAIGIMAPLVEEVVFRGAILRTLLDMMGKKWHWVAILISAAMFGTVHGNMAQFLNAMLLGMVLGWMYYRTKSIVPGILMHWVNNSVAYILANVVPNSNAQLIELFGGNEQTMYFAVGFSLCIAIPSLFQMVVRLKPAH